MLKNATVIWPKYSFSFRFISVCHSDAHPHYVTWEKSKIPLQTAVNAVHFQLWQTISSCRVQEGNELILNAWMYWQSAEGESAFLVYQTKLGGGEKGIPSLCDRRFSAVEEETLLVCVADRIIWIFWKVRELKIANSINFICLGSWSPAPSPHEPPLISRN